MRDILTLKNNLLTIAMVSLIAMPALAQDDETWSLCPEPGLALQDVPAGPAEIQADIDRFTLCLDRAELLLKLEEVSARNNELMIGDSMGGMALPINPQPLSVEQTENLLASNGSGAPTQAIELPDYKVLAINGAAGQLSARLSTPDGDIQMVQLNDSLEDGSIVSAITSSQVSVRKDGKTRILNWDS